MGRQSRRERHDVDAIILAHVVVLAILWKFLVPSMRMDIKLKSLMSRDEANNTPIRIEIL